MLGPLTRIGRAGVKQIDALFAFRGATLTLDRHEYLVGRRWGWVGGEFQNERVEETRDRAERGNAVRGSDQASVEPEHPPPPTYRHRCLRC